MPFDFTELKSQVREAVHAAFAVSAHYIDDDLVMPVPVTVRWHNKIDRFGDLTGAGYSEVIEGVERLIFNRTELAQKGVVLQAGGEVALADPRWDGAVLVLGSMEPRVGPVEEVWMVGRQ